jgi:ribonuclease HII
MFCGLDEAGRGPLAGPVCAGAVILPDDFPREVLADSKKLSATKREKAAPLIRERALAWGVGWASHQEIDKINILQASLLAMKRAFASMLEALPASLRKNVLEVIVDGMYTPDLSDSAQSLVSRSLVKADSLVPEVMAASILAKTSRDAEMIRYSVLYPQYGYERHKGYPTKEHRELIARHGPSPIQRMSFCHVQPGGTQGHLFK